MNIHDNTTNTPLGLIIKNIDPSRQQRHTGFIYIKNQIPTLAHFGGKDYFRSETNIQGYAMSWLDFLPERTANAIITELELIAKNLTFKAPYGIINEGGTEFHEGVLIKNPNTEGDGLTCAVFIICLLEQFDFPLIDRESWELTNEDKRWQEWILNLLEGRLNPEYMKVQRENVGLVKRFRPEQVVGAGCIFDFVPVGYTDACRAAEIVLEQLDVLRC